MKFLIFMAVIVGAFGSIAAFGNEVETRTSRVAGTLAAQQVLDRMLYGIGASRGVSTVLSTLIAAGGSLAIQQAVLKQKIKDQNVIDTVIGAGGGMFFSLVFPLQSSPKSVESQPQPINIHITNTNNNGRREEE